MEFYVANDMTQLAAGGAELGLTSAHTHKLSLGELIGRETAVK